MWPARLSQKQRQGQDGERHALDYLVGQGLRLVEANFRCRSGEIDLILQDGKVLVFVEVRQRASTFHGGAAASITPAKKRRVVNAAQTYLQRLPRLPPCRIDIIAIDGDRLDWLQDAVQV
jgi:putative endonuclease